MSSAGQNESKCQKLAPIDKKKIFHEFDVHHGRKYESNVFGLRRPK